MDLKCNNCGKNYDEDNDKCPVCHQDKNETSEINKLNHFEEKKVVCNYCGFICSDSYRFCPKCGSDIEVMKITHNARGANISTNDEKDITNIPVIKIDNSRNIDYLIEMIDSQISNQQSVEEKIVFNTWKVQRLIINVLSFVLSAIIFFESFFVVLLNTVSQNGEQSGVASLAFAMGWVLAGILGIVFRVKKLGTLITGIIYMFFGFLGMTYAGSFQDLYLLSFISVGISMIFIGAVFYANYKTCGKSWFGWVYSILTIGLFAYFSTIGVDSNEFDTSGLTKNTPQYSESIIKNEDQISIEVKNEDIYNFEIADEVGIMSNIEESKYKDLNDTGNLCSDDLQLDICILFINSIGYSSGYELDQYAENYIDSAIIDGKISENTIIALISTKADDRGIVIQGYGDAEINIDNDELDTIINEMIPFLKENEFYDAIMTLIDLTYRYW